MARKGHEVAIEVSQDAAMKAGKNEWGWIIIEVDAAELTEDERAAFTALPTGRTGLGGQDHVKRIGELGADVAVGEATVETLKTLLRGRIERERKLREVWMATPLGELIHQARGRYDPKGMSDYLYRPSPDDRSWTVHHAFARDYPQLMDLRRDEIDAWIAADLQQWREEIRAEEDASRTERDAKLAAAEAERDAKRAYVTEIVATHADANMQARHEAGMLDLGEALALAEEVIFQALADEPRFQKLTETDVDHSDDCHCTPDDIDYDVDTIDTATAEQWDRLQALKAKLGRDDAALTLRQHTAEPLCTGPTRRYGVRIAISEGGYDFIREYACPGGYEQPPEENN